VSGQISVDFWRERKRQSQDMLSTARCNCTW